jgi:hypothetical protein
MATCAATTTFARTGTLLLIALVAMLLLALAPGAEARVGPTASSPFAPLNDGSHGRALKWWRWHSWHRWWRG